MTDNHKIVKAPDVAIQSSQMHPLVSAAMRGGELDTQTLRELMELQKDWEKNEAKKAYTRDMVSLKAQLPAVLDKDKSVSFGAGKTSYTFTSLAHAMEEISPCLTRFGFSLSWIPVTTDRQVSVTCRLTHTLGHYEETTMSGPADASGSKNPIQAIGSTVSYLSRYTALSLLGIATADMKCVDEQAAAQPRIDSDKNLAAVSYLASLGIDVAAAEAHVQKSVKDWNSNDLAALRALAKGGRQPKSDADES